MKVVIQRVRQSCVKGKYMEKLGKTPKYCYFLNNELEVLPMKIVPICPVESNLNHNLFIWVNNQPKCHIVCFLNFLSSASRLLAQLGLKSTLILFGAKKVLNVRFFESEDQKKWSKNVMDKEYEVLCVSQFTLCHQLKGNRLDFHHAMNPDDSVKFYEKFLSSLKRQYKPEMIKDGKFGAYMQVELCNDGPVTVTLESKSKKNVTESENVDEE